ncbi:hypothetical protein [Parendozoicomonas haliclonae]|uniref:Uncharacterized protein n=1 Tax=Parendozoicomonas haliclonae TaxID=1960125 RepID=A0A1X7AFS1_9GAMM|nr:hypothetical protein [Parendozoicomonas haliclonae]SMA36946.1 hypothetical protein EHSB41UT_00670 [Parendozoicomonas haliclonae]
MERAGYTQSTTAGQQVDPATGMPLVGEATATAGAASFQGRGVTVVEAQQLLMEDLQQHLSGLLELQLDSFGSKCFSAQLIDDDTSDDISDIGRSSLSKREMTNLFLRSLQKKIRASEQANDDAGARSFCSQIGEIIRNKDVVLRSTGEDIMGIAQNKAELASRGFRKRMDMINDAIQSSLERLATSFNAADMISDEEHDAATDPKSGAAKAQLEQTWRAIEEAVANNPDESIEALKKVFHDLGDPVRSAAKEYFQKYEALVKSAA